MIPNESLKRITCALQEIQRVFDQASTELADVLPDLRAFVFATASADAALRAQMEQGEQKQQADTAVSPRPSASRSVGIAQQEGKNVNDSDSEDAQNAKPTPDYAGKPRNRHQIHKTVKDSGLRGDASWCE